MKFIAYAQTNKIGSRCEIEFEIDDEVFEDMSEDERGDYIQREAMEAAWGNSLVEVGYEEVES